VICSGRRDILLNGKATLFRKTSIILITVLLALGAGAFFRMSLRPALAASGQVFIDPAVAGVMAGEEYTVTLQTTGLTGVYAADVVLSFAPAILQVVDADGVAGGVQVVEGTCPAADFAVSNQADNALGLITYTVTQLNPTAACSSGYILQIPFSCSAAGISQVSVDSSLISDRNGLLIAHTTVGGTIACIANPPAAIIDLDGALSSGNVDLSWTDVTSDTLDNPTILAFYQVHRSTAPYFTPMTGTLLTTSTVPFYTDAGGAGDPATNYYYNVLAEDLIGLVGSPSNRVGEFDFELVPAPPP